MSHTDEDRRDRVATDKRRGGVFKITSVGRLCYLQAFAFTSEVTSRGWQCRTADEPVDRQLERMRVAMYDGKTDTEFEISEFALLRQQQEFVAVEQHAAQRS